MSINIQRVDENSYKVSFPTQNYKPLIIEIDKKEGFESEIEKNHDFYFNLVSRVAKNIHTAKSTNTTFDNIITIGNKEWVVNVKQKTTSIASKIFPVIHEPGVDQTVRLKISQVDKFNPALLIQNALNRISPDDQKSRDNENNELKKFSLNQAKIQNKEDCKQYPEMMSCSNQELEKGVRGKFAYPADPSSKDRLSTSQYASPFTTLATLAFQRYETEFRGRDNFKTSDCKYCIVLHNHELILTPRSASVESNRKVNRETVHAYFDLLSTEVGAEKLNYACQLAKINMDQMLEEGTPLTPEHIYRLNILTSDVEIEDLEQFLQKIQAIDIEKLKKTESLEESLLKTFTYREIRGLSHAVGAEKGTLSNEAILDFIKNYKQNPQLDKMSPSQVNQLAGIFFPLAEDRSKIFTGRDIYYPIKSAYTVAEKKEYKPWIDQQELMQTFPIIQKTEDWDLYHEKLSHVICKKHLFRPHPTKQYATGALIPAPMGSDNTPRWMYVDQAVYNGYGMLNYTLKPLGNDPSLPLIKLFVSTSSSPYAAFGVKTIRTDFNPLQLTGYEGIGKTDLYESNDFLQNSIPVWTGYVMAAIQAQEEQKLPKDLLGILSKANAELWKYELEKAKVYSLNQILRRHNGILNSLFLKGKIDLPTYEHIRSEYFHKPDFRVDQKEFLKLAKSDAEKLISRLTDIKFDLSDFSETMQPQIATEMDALIQELNAHLIIPEAQDEKKQLMKKLGEKIVDDCLAHEQVLFDLLQKETRTAMDEQIIQDLITEWIDKLIEYAYENKEIPAATKTRDIHFVGHSLGGSFAQIYSLHHLVKQNRIPFYGHVCKIHAFDSPGIAREDNEIFKKFMLDHHSMLKAIDTKFSVIHQHEAGDPVHTIGSHLGSAKSSSESDAILEVLDFKASVMKRLPNATHPSLVYAKTVHGTQFLEGVEEIDYSRKAVSPHDMGLMESYETMKDLPEEILISKGEKLRQEVWQFPLPLATSSFETLRSNPTAYWIAGQLLANMVNPEPEMIPFLDPMGNFSANTKGLNYADKEFYTSSVYPPGRPNWIQKLSEEKLRAKLYPGSDIKAMVRMFGDRGAIQNIEETAKALVESFTESRNYMLDLGGERLTIKTSAGNLDGLILRPNKLWDLIKAAGGVQLKASIDILKSNLWVLDANSDPQIKLFKAMENMRFFKMGLDYTTQDNYCYIGDEDFIFAMNATPSEVKFEDDVDAAIPKSDKGVLICGGNLSVYERFSSEATSFLLRGMNVMLFNPPGFGESQGTPNEETLTEGILAAFDNFAKKARLKEENILIKSLCMSGGWASNLARQRPKSALWLDQTYSSFYPLVQDQVIRQLRGALPKQLEGIISNLIPQFCIPAFDVSKNLAHHHGWKCLMYAEQDEVIPASHILRNIEATEDSNPIKVIEIPGKHSQTWYRLKDVSNVTRETDFVKQQVDFFLQRAGFLNPIFRIEDAI